MLSAYVPNIPGRPRQDQADPMIATSTTTTRTKATTTTTKTTRTNITTRTATIKTTGKNGPAGLAPGYHEVGGRKAAPSKTPPMHWREWESTKDLEEPHSAMALLRFEALRCSPTRTLDISSSEGKYEANALTLIYNDSCFPEDWLGLCR